MANDKDHQKLKEGVKTWNAWRVENPELRVDLSNVNLSGMYLSEANLSSALGLSLIFHGSYTQSYRRNRCVVH